MKKCPKCGANNRDDSAACSKCFAPLEGAQAGGQSAATRQAATPAQPRQPAQPQPDAQPQNGGPAAGYNAQAGGPLLDPEEPAEPVSAAGEPLGAEQQPPTPAYTPAPGPYPPPTRGHSLRRGEFPRLQPVRRSSPARTALIAVLVIAVLGGGGFAAWKFLLHKGDPVATVRELIRASAANDTEAVKKCLSAASQSGLGAASMFMPLGSNGKRGSEPKLVEGQDYTLELASKEESTAAVNIRLKPAVWDKLAQSAGQGPGAQFAQMLLPMIKEAMKDGTPIGLVKEGRQWKVDNQQTEIAMKPIMEKMQQAASKMFGGMLGPSFGAPGGTPGRVPGATPGGIPRRPGMPGMQPGKPHKR